MPPLGFVLGGAGLAAYQRVDAAPETAYLTLLGGWTLGGAALLAPLRSRLGAAAALFAAMALWALPAGAVRGTAFGVVLAATVCAAGWARLRHGELDLAAATGGALAAHALLRAGELLPARLGWVEGTLDAGAAAELARAVAPPLLAGAAAWALAQRRGAPTAIGVAAAAALAAGGFTVTGALPLLALAIVAAVVGSRDDDAAPAFPRRDEERGDEAVSTIETTTGASRPRDDAGSSRSRSIRKRFDITVQSLRDSSGAARALLVVLALATLALTAMRPAAGALAIGGAAALRLPRRWAWAPAAALLLFAAFRSGAPDKLDLAARAVAALVLLAPFAFARDAVSLADLASALLVAVAGALLLPGTAGIAAAAALLALVLPEAEAAKLQRGWWGVLLALAALAAVYPWLREPLRSALGFLGWNAGAPAVVHAAVAVTAIPAAWLLVALARRTLSRTAGAALAAVVALALVWAMPARVTNVLPPDGAAVRIDAPAWAGSVEGPIARVRIVSTLAGAGSLERGTPVAVVALEPAGDGTEPPLADWTLRAGLETGEWAADRPDLRGYAPRATPWWSWLPPPGTFFAHAYVSTWRSHTEVPAARIRVVRAAELPPEVTVSLLRIEVGR